MREATLGVVIPLVLEETLGAALVMEASQPMETALLVVRALALAEEAAVASK